MMLSKKMLHQCYKPNFQIMDYKYNEPMVVELTENILSVVKYIAKLDSAFIEDAIVAINQDNYSAVYIDGDDYIMDDLKGGQRFGELDIYPILSSDWLYYDADSTKYIISIEDINNFAYEYDKKHPIPEI
jgi:hypothetical protein